MLIDFSRYAPIKALGICLTSLLWIHPSMAQLDPSGTWLDEDSNWNSPGGSLPQAPVPEFSALADCEISIRPATLPEDQQVEAAGWTLTGDARLYGDTTIITGMADADGMCRPLDYQVFIFTGGEFSGTLSPIPMDSRTDGSLIRFALYREGFIDASFNRYTAEDPLCCASSQSRVFYEVEIQNDGPVVVPRLPADTISSPE